MKLAFVTPSKIDSDQRLNFARKSIKSRYDILPNIKHYIVDSSFPRYKNAVMNMYNKCEIINSNVDMLTATKIAINHAIHDGHQYIFIHLDDMYYIPICNQLLEYCKSLTNMDIIRLSGWPIIFPGCVNGNATFLDIQNDMVKIKNAEVSFKPERKQDFTLWSTAFKDIGNVGRFWTLPMWFTIYSTELITHLLKTCPQKNGTLGNLEVYHRNNWNKVKNMFPNKRIGYINMQFGGFEMHRHHCDISKFTNKEIR